MSEDPRSRFPAPPRKVPAGLWCALVANYTMMWGAVLFGVGSLLLAPFLFVGHPAGNWRLDRERQETLGRLESLQRTGSKGDVYRYVYSFRTPDGAQIRGASYAEGPVPPGPEVIVEYSPKEPGLNRLKGTRTTEYPRGVEFIWFALVLVPLAPGGFLLLRGLARGRRQIRLLRQADLAEATVIACRFTFDRSSPALPVAEFRERWQEQWTRIVVGKSMGLVSGLIGCIMLPIILATILGSVAALFSLIMVIFFDWPASINGRLVTDKTESVPYLLKFFAAWTFGGVAGIFLIRFLSLSIKGRMVTRRLREMAAAVPASVPLPEKDVRLEVEMTFEFRTPDSEVVRARDVAVLSGSLGDEARELVLYDPARPKRAVLLDGLSVPVRLMGDGKWGDLPGLAPRIRMGVLALSLALGVPLIGWMLWGFLR